MIRPLLVSTLVLLGVFVPCNVAHAQGGLADILQNLASPGPGSTVNPGTPAANPTAANPVAANSPAGPKTIDELTAAEKSAIATAASQQTNGAVGSGTFEFNLNKLRTRRTNQEWAQFLVDSAVSAEQKQVRYYDGIYQALKPNIISRTTALGIPYTEQDLSTSWTKLSQSGTYVNMQQLEALLLADAVLNAVKKSGSATTAAGSAPRPVAGQASSIDAFLGTYRYEPYSNTWHQGTIQQTPDGALKWTNQANVSWFLDPNGSGALRKRAGSPYQDQPNGQEFVIVRDAGGKVTGFQFQGETYRKL